MVVATVQGHADDLLRVARRYSLCADDAHEAYQRALEIYVRHARRLEADTAHRWLFTVLKHEALAVRKQRSQLLGAEESELDRLESRTTDSPEDRAIAADDIGRAAAALRRLKPDEIRALWLKASGLSYAEIMEETSWSYTKVNRCLAEGRASLAKHLSAIESGADCEQYMPLLSRLLDGEASRKELRPLRAHLRGCAGCRAELRALHDRGDAIRVVLPSGVLAGSAATGAPDVPGLLTRLYESVATSIHDRAAMSAIKLQAAIEATSTGKLAAVAASAAAVAGGGATAATQPPNPTPPRAPQHRAATPPKPPTTPAATVSRSTPQPTAPSVDMRSIKAPSNSRREDKRPKTRLATRPLSPVPGDFEVSGSRRGSQRAPDVSVATASADGEFAPGRVSARPLTPPPPKPTFEPSRQRPPVPAAELEFTP